MAKTNNDCLVHTRVFLDEINQDDWLDTQVQREVNNGYQEVITAVMETYEDFYLIKTQFNTVADQQEYGTTDSVPSDIFKIRRLELNYNVSDSNSLPVLCKPVNLSEINGTLNNANIGINLLRNAAYYLIGSGTGSNGIKIGFIPIPTRSGTNAVSLWYIPIQSDLSASGDNVNIPYADRYYKLIALYGAAQLLRKGQQEEVAAAKYMDEFTRGLEKMKQQLEDRVSDDAKHVIDTEMIDVDFSFPDI